MSGPAEPAARAQDPRAASGTLLPLLAAITAVGAITLNIYLPARPAAQAEFKASAFATGLTVSLAGVAFAIGLLCYGPWSDRRGRRPAILTGLGLFTVGTAVAASATSMTMLIAGRVIQALGSAAGVTVGRAVVSDVFPREDIARSLAYLTMVVAVANALAPSAGGLLTHWYGWRAVFAALLAAAAGVVYWTASSLPETLRPLSHPPPSSGITRTITALLCEPTFLACALQNIVVYSAFLVFASYMPFVMTRALGASVASYGVWYLLIALGYFLGNFTVTRLTTRTGSSRLLRAGVTIQMLASLLALALAGLHYWHPFAIFGPWLVLAFGQGLILPSVTATAVALRPAAAGTAAGLLGFLQQIGAAVAVQSMAMASFTSPVPVSAFIALVCTAAWLAAIMGGPLLEYRPAAGT